MVSTQFVALITATFLIYYFLVNRGPLWQRFIGSLMLMFAGAFYANINHTQIMVFLGWIVIAIGGLAFVNHTIQLFENTSKW